MDQFHGYLQYISEMHLAGMKLLKHAEQSTSACNSLIPLGLALVEAARLFDFIANQDENELAAIFDGGEGYGPNLDTRLKCIRDLCSASAYSLLHKPTLISDFVDIAYSSTPGEQHWLGLLRGRTCCDEQVVEVARLLDDIFGSFIQIAHHIKGFESDRSLLAWHEVSRNVIHIRDHYDFAEDMVIACICPSRI